MAALDGGITNRNYRVRFGGTDYVVRLPGKDTALLGIDRQAECTANKHAADLGIAPPVAAFLESPACLVTRFVPGRELTAEELREPANLTEVAHALRKFHDSGVELPTDFDSFRVVEDLRRRGGLPRRSGASGARGWVGACARDPPGRIRARGAPTGALPWRSVECQLSARRRTREDRGLGVRRAWGIATSISGTSPSTTNWAPTKRTSSSPEYFGAPAPRPASRDARALPLHVRLPRGHLGHDSGRRLLEIDFNFEEYAQ